MSKRLWESWDKCPFETDDDEAVRYWPWYMDDTYTKLAADFVNSSVYDAALTTPDIKELAASKTQLVAIYGTLKAGYSRSSSMKGAEKLCSVISCEGDFTMLEGLGKDRFPVLFRGPVECPHPPKHFFAELYLCPTTLIPALDVIEANGHLYTREMVQFEMLGGHGETVDAWTYLGWKEKWDRSILNRELTRSISFQRNKEPKLQYYFFSKPILAK